MIFVDTGYWIAAADARDDHHEEAFSLALSYRDRRLITTNHVLGETWTFLRKRHGHGIAVGFLDRMARSEHVRTVFVRGQVEQAAWSWLRRRDERRYSFVDATSFALMRRLAIHEAFTFDGDFAAAGFLELRL